MPAAGQAVTRETFSFAVDKSKLKAAQQRDGHYLRSNLTGEDPAVLWTRYVQLTQTMHAPGLTPAAVFEKLATIRMVEVWIPMVDGHWLVMPRHTQPEPADKGLSDPVKIGRRPSSLW